MANMHTTDSALMPAGGHWVAIAANERREVTLPVVGWERGLDASGEPALWAWLQHGAALMRSDAVEGYRISRFKDVTPECGCQSGD